MSARSAAQLPEGTRVRAQGRVEKTTKGYRLVLEIESRGERVLDAETCDALASSTAIVLAMSATPVQERSPRPASGPKPAPPVVTSATPPADRDVRGPSDDVRRTKLGARVHAIGDAGTLPALGGGGGIALGIDVFERLRLEVVGNYWPAQDGRLSGNPSRGASFQLMGAGARGCWALTRSVVVAPCLGAEVVALSGDGFGAARTSGARSIAWAPEAALTVRIPLGKRFGIAAGAGATAPTSRQTFVIASGGDVHQPSPLVARGWIGPEVVF